MNSIANVSIFDKFANKQEQINNDILATASSLQMTKKTKKIDKIFKAIADPTRREILYLLVAASSTLNINDITEKFNSTRQGITKHIKVLEDVGLVEIKKQGRDNYCIPNTAPLKEVHEWILVYEKFWELKFEGLKKFLDKA